MLFGEQFGRRHQRDLLTVGNSAQGGKRGNQRLPGTVALNQTHHRHIERHIVFGISLPPAPALAGLTATTLTVAALRYRLYLAVERDSAARLREVPAY